MRSRLMLTVWSGRAHPSCQVSGRSIAWFHAIVVFSTQPPATSWGATKRGLTCSEPPRPLLMPAATFFGALAIGWYLHFLKIVKNEHFGYPDVRAATWRARPLELVLTTPASLLALPNPARA